MKFIDCTSEMYVKVVEILLNFGHNSPSSGRFYKLTNPVDARD